MSLLLDALKKAADDKKKASQGGFTEEAAPLVKTQESDEVVSLEDKEVDVFEELVLDDEQDKVSAEEGLTLQDVSTGENKKPAAEDVDEKAASVASHTDLTAQQRIVAERSKEAATTVSDEALSMLIYKTNRDVKHSNRIVFVSVFLLSLTVLISGGIYYYMDMQAEIEGLNRKHQIAMQAMRHKTSEEEAPEPSNIIRKLVSDADADAKVAFAKEQIKRGKSVVNGSNNSSIQDTKSSPDNQVSQQKNQTVANSTSTVSFQKTKKADPLGEKLEQAWQEYANGQYGNAKKLYKEVIQAEGGNRDALLGLGAIAVIEDDTVRARRIYRDLLSKDPRDPIAIAALAGLQNDDVSLEENEKYLVEMLQQNPDAAELNFALANNYAQQAKWKAAQKYYFTAWQHEPENADYLFNLAVSLDQLGKSKQAVQFYSDSLKKAKDKQVGFSREAVQQRIVALSAL